MIHKVYNTLTQFLNLLFKLWILEYHDFALEGDGDIWSRYLAKKKSSERESVERRSMDWRVILTALQSPDLAVIKNCWAIPKIYDS